MQLINEVLLGVKGCVECAVTIRCAPKLTVCVMCLELIMVLFELMGGNV